MEEPEEVDVDETAVVKEAIGQPGRVPPAFQQSSFVCPHCDSQAQQLWGRLRYYGIFGNDTEFKTNYFIAICGACSEFSVWEGHTSAIPHPGDFSIQPARMIDPRGSLGPRPHADMPPEILADFEEARSIAGQSPRGASALLRLAVQKLLIHLGEKGKNLDDDIASLVAQGLPSTIQQALDSLRVIGNNAVHPGQMDLKDDTETVGQLFTLLNVIVQDRITQPKVIAGIYEGLPDTQRDRITERDGQN